MTTLISFSAADMKAGCIVRASNAGWTRSIGIAFYVPDPSLLERLAVTPIGSTITVQSELAPKGSPCAMQMLDFGVVTGE